MPRFAIQITVPNKAKLNIKTTKYVCGAHGELSDDLNDAFLCERYNHADSYIDVLKTKYPDCKFKILAINLIVDENFDYANS